MSNKLALGTDFNAKVVEKVRDTFMDLIPDDVLQTKINEEITAFFDDTTTRYKVTSVGYGGSSELTASVSPFRLIVWNQVNKMVRKKVDAFFQQPDFQVQVSYDNGQTDEIMMSELMDKKLEKIALKMATNMFRETFCNAIMSAKHELQNDINNGIVQNY